MRPGGKWIYVTLDILSAHKGIQIREWAQAYQVELCITPTYSWWTNPIEPYFGPLRKFILNNSTYPNHVVLTRRLQAHLFSRLNAAGEHESEPRKATAGDAQPTKQDEPHAPERTLMDRALAEVRLSGAPHRAGPSMAYASQPYSRM